jgi:hypothetical protein
LPRNAAHDTTTDHVEPELFIAQHHPETPHAIDAEPTHEALCQHSSFGRLVLMPPPHLSELVPPAVCRQDTAATLTVIASIICYWSVCH